MLAAEDGVASTTAAMQPVTFLWDDPNDSPDAGVKPFDRFYGIVEGGYDARGGPDSDLPGGATISGGRATSGWRWMRPVSSTSPARATA